MARKTKEDAERTRQQIIHAARLVFHECGVSRTSLEKISEGGGRDARRGVLAFRR